MCTARTPRTTTDRIAGPQSARVAHKVPAAGRLHAMVAHDEQSIRIGRNLGAQAVLGDITRLEVQVTFYDRHAFVRPVSAVYAFRPAKELEAAGHRVQHWECETSNNDVSDKGTTTSRLPGEAGFKDGRGTTLFRCPRQPRDPMYNTTLPVVKE